MEKNNVKPSIFYLPRLLFRFDREIKSFPDKQILREFSTPKPALQKMLRNFSNQETQKKKRLKQNKPKQLI